MPFKATPIIRLGCYRADAPEDTSAVFEARSFAFCPAPRLALATAKKRAMERGAKGQQYGVVGRLQKGSPVMQPSATLAGLSRMQISQRCGSDPIRYPTSGATPASAPRQFRHSSPVER